MNHLKSWASGFVDGEGCFTIEKKKYSDGRNRDVYYRPKLSVHVRADDSKSLRLLQEAFEDDGYYYERKSRKTSTYGSVSKPTVECTWHKMESLIAIVRTFDKHQLLGKKSQDYTIWRKAVMIYVNKDMASAERQGLLKPLRLELQEIKKFK